MNSVTITMMLVVAITSGLIGSFALMRKMALASDAMSHVALPGLGLALLLHFNPLIGGAAALIMGTILIWVIQRQTQISTETVIGVIFSTSLALGSLLTPSKDLEDVLFGGFTPPGLGEALAAIALALLIGALVFYFKEKIVFSLVSADLAKTLGINVDIINLTFLLLFAINVLLGLKFLGVLLMGALMIVPAAAAKNLAWSLNSDLFISAAASVTSVIVGLLIASAFNLALGPVMISVAAALFFVSMFVKAVLYR